MNSNFADDRPFFSPAKLSELFSHNISELQLQLVRWGVPVLLFLLVVGYELFEHLTIHKNLADPSFFSELFFFGIVGPTSAFVALSWMLKQWRLHQQDVEKLRNLYLELSEVQKTLTLVNNERLALLRYQVNFQEQERKRIATELHDELGSLLTRLNLDLSLCCVTDTTSSSIELQRHLETSQNLIIQIMDQLHDLCASLHPPLLDRLGLVAAIRHDAKKRLEAHQLDLKLQVDDNLENLPEEISLAAFRIAQEAITNVIRHAGASTVQISLAQQNNSLELSVADDGVGLSPATAHRETSSLGLVGMRERALAVGGEFSIDQNTVGGVCVRVKFPLSEGING